MNGAKEEGFHFQKFSSRQNKGKSPKEKKKVLENYRVKLSIEYVV